MFKAKAFFIKHNITIGIFSIVFSIFAYFYPWNNKPDLKFYFQKRFTIISSSRTVDSLSIFFKGKNIAKDSLNLIAERIKIVNKGADIRLSDFGSDPFGIKIINCKIIGVIVPKISDHYLKETLKPYIADSNNVFFQKTIFEKDKEVYIDVYLLYPKHNEPDYTPLGKVAGQEKIDIFQSDEEGERFSDIAWLVFAIMIIIFYAVFLPIHIYRIGVRIRKWIRKKRISTIYGHPLKELNDEQIILVKIYTELNDKEFINLLKNFLDYAPFIKTFWDANLAINKVNKWMQDTKKRFLRYRMIDLDTPYSKAHNLLKKANLIIRDENNIPVQLKDDFLEEVRNTLGLFDQDL